MPYIYSLAGAAWLEDASMMKPLVFAFPKDREVYDCKDQYLFGDRLMVCPVTESMYNVEAFSEEKAETKTRTVYLPAGENWYDFWTDKCYEGGQRIEAEAPLDRIPLFVREGSIIPMYKEDCIPENTAVKVPEDGIEYRVYKGKNASFYLYEDAGNGYGYERGEYTRTLLEWDEKKGVILATKC
jgi:alpha-D-xyloside xylohydrolase